jgi:cytochrome c556
MTLKRLSVVLLACLTLSACGGVDPNSPLGQRKAIFKQMLKTGEDLGGMLRGRIPFDGQKFADGAVKLDALSREPWKHFPQVREEDHTSAKDNVWQQQARFQEMSRDLEAATGELVIASQVQPYKASNLGPAVQNVEDACSACHKQFRDH